MNKTLSALLESADSKPQQVCIAPTMGLSRLERTARYGPADKRGRGRPQNDASPSFTAAHTLAALFGEWRARWMWAWDDLMGMCLDITPAYCEPGRRVGLNHYCRILRLEADGLQLYDEADFPGTVALNLMSGIPQAEPQIVLCSAEAAITGTQYLDIEAIPISDPIPTRICFTGRLCQRLG